MSTADVDELSSRMRAGHAVKPTARFVGTVDQHAAPGSDCRATSGGWWIEFEDRKEISRGLAAASRCAIAARLVAHHRRSAVGLRVTAIVHRSSCGR